MPQVFSGCPPPINAVSRKGFAGFSQGVFGIIFLHESMTVWVHTLKEEYQSVGEDPNEKVCIHDPYKNANLCTTPPADSHPYIYFDWMLGAWLAMCF